MKWTRRSLLCAAPAGWVTAVAAADPFLIQHVATRPADSLPASYPAQDPDLVRETVGAAHGRIDRVRELLGLSSALAKATWDWGFGDWETALGAASHTGNREIAALLIEHGARPDVFTFAMLGQLDVVKALVAANPGVQRLHGPHGITLLQHARAGGAKSAGVVEFLTSLGDADIGQISVELDADWAKKYPGDYSLDATGNDRLIVAPARNGGLTIQRGKTGTPRNLLHQGQHTFHPTGAPRVVIRFDVADERVSTLRIIDAGVERTAARVPAGG